VHLIAQSTKESCARPRRPHDHAVGGGVIPHRSTQLRWCSPLVFQLAEGGIGGAKAMLQDGLFKRFPCESVFRMDNRPGLPIVRFVAIMRARGAFFDITVTGKGSHAARPD
jgi:metal-dependent amidase/aminoacylase/carboxypeptidase family protein